jgi:putative SOS response-associated peptidase YedK
MTVLYRLDAPAAAIAAQFAPIVTAGREFVAGPRGERQPRRMIPRQWGVPPPPSAGETGRSVLTVRNPDSPFWIGNLRNTEFRCLLPATAFMEWGKTRDAAGKRRQHWFSCADQPLFAFAGVWKDSEVPSFALLTVEPNAALRHAGCERMPAILPPDPATWQVWLGADWKRASALLVPYSSSLMVER